MEELHKTLEGNLTRVRGRIAEAARRAGRPADDVQILAVTKTRRVEVAAELARLGQLDLGENRAEDLVEKVDWFRAHGLVARWHFIGHVQRNKARRVVENADVIHSVDSLRLLEALERIAEETRRSPEIYLQVKLHPEDTKSGFDPSEVEAALVRARASRSVRVVGLMTMAPLVEHDEVRRIELARAVFTRLAQLARELDARALDEHSQARATLRLSMGMSDDLEIAVEAGSHCVRVGSALFEGLSNTEIAA